MTTRWRAITRKLAETARCREPDLTAQQSAWLSGDGTPQGYVDYIEESERGARARFAAAVAYSDRPLDSHNLKYAVSAIGISTPIDSKMSKLAGRHARRLVRGLGGTTQTCEHVRRDDPVEVVGCPSGSRLDCLRCFPEALFEMPEREAGICDVCGNRDPLQVLDLLLPHIGSVTLIVGICHDCMFEMRRSSKA
jgi:hypothetical protein